MITLSQLCRRCPIDVHAPMREATLAELAQTRIAVILQYEPSWFAEFMSGLGILCWAILSFITDDYRIHGWEWAMPVIGLLFGPLRVWFLVHLDGLPRVLSAGAGVVWWGWLSYAMWHAWGPVPGEAALIALFAGDILTLAKFSFSAMIAEAEAGASGVGGGHGP